MLLLADLLAAEDLGLTLVSGGADALEREIAGAHSIDVEAPTRFLERRWLMLTAGLRLRGSAAAQRDLIAELDAAGISALGIGLGLVFQRVPRALLEAARERSFPVLAVPLDTPFRDIAGFVNRSLLSSDLHSYQRLTAIQRHLVDALREPHPRQAMVERLARMLDAGVLVLDGPSAGAVPDSERVRRRVAEREFEEDGWHVVTVPIPPAGWLAVAARRRIALARAAAQAAVPLLAAIERLAELAREQEHAVRAALVDELLELAPGAETRGLAARAAAFGLEFPARVIVSGARLSGHLATTHRGRSVALVPGDEAPRAGAGIGRPVHDVTGIPRSYRDAVLALEQGVLAYEDFDLPTLLLSAGDPELLAPRVDALLAPLGPPLLDALVEYFAHDMDVNAAAERMHVHPNTLRYRLARVEERLGRSLKSPLTIAELSLALRSRAV